MGEDMQDTRWGGYLGVVKTSLLALFCLVLALFATPAAAQIVTPLPGPAATATAAAQNMTQAQSQKDAAAQQAASSAAQASYAARQAEQAAQAAQQAAQAQAAADASFNAAAQAAAEARAALVAQQVGAASEALGRAEESISAGRSQLNSMAGIVDSQKQTIDTLAAQLQKTQSDYQALQTANGATIQVNQALQAQLAEARSHFTVNPAIAAIVGVCVLALVLGFVVWKWSHRDPVIDPTPAEPPLDGDYTVSD